MRKKLVTIRKSSLSGKYFALSPTPFGKRHIPLAGARNRSEAEQVVLDGNFEATARLGAVTDKAVAIHMAKQLIGRKVTVTTAIEEWELAIESSHCYAPATAVNYLINLRQWAREHNMGQRMIFDITAAHVSKFVNEKCDLKVSTLKQRLATMMSFFGWCLRRRYTLFNPAWELRRVSTRNIPIERKEKRARMMFTVEEEAALLAECDRLIGLVHANKAALNSTCTAANQARKRYDADANRWLFWKFAIIVGMHVGLRFGDIAAMEWGQIKGNRLICWTRKRDRRIDVPVDDATLAVIAQVPNMDARFLFPEQAETENDPLRRHALAMQFIRLRKSIGIMNKNFHDTRSTYVSRLIASGVPIEKASDMVGHASAETTKGYVVDEQKDQL